MSNSKRKPIIKDRKYKEYWRRVRRAWTTEMKSFKDEDWEKFELSSPKVIVNDYDYRDYVFFFNEDKFKRK